MPLQPPTFFEVDGGIKTVTAKESRESLHFGHADVFYWILTLDGVATFTELDRPQFLNRGYVLIRKGPFRHEIRLHRQGAPWRFLYLAGQNAFTINRMSHIVQQAGRLHQVSLSSNCVKLAHKLIHGKNLNHWQRSTLAFEWFHAWWQEAEKSKQQVLRLLEEKPSANNPSWHINSLKDLADQLGYSPGYLSDVLAKKWQKSPARSLRKARLEYAAKRLRESSIRISELSSELGYMSESSFIRAFRLHYGVSPEKFRKSHATI